VAALPGSEIRKAFIIAATAAVEGADTAIKKSLQITSEEHDRSKALVTAGYLLLRNRRYPEAAALYSAGGPGQTESSQLLALAEVLRNTKPFEQIQIPESDPRSVIQRSLILGVLTPLDPQENLKLASTRTLELYERKDLLERVTRLFYLARNRIDATQLPLEVAVDMALSNAKYSEEGDENLGYRVTMQTPNSAGQVFFLVHEDGKYKLENFLSSNDLGREALAHLERNDLAGARRWLDWARENVRLGGGDDPLDGPVFPRFWTKGQEGDAATIRLAALSALASTRFIAGYIPEFVQARDAAKGAEERVRLNLVLAEAYRSQKRWNELLAVAQELVKAYPDSNHAFDIAVIAFRGLKDFDQWDQLLQGHLHKHPDEPEYLRSKAALALSRGDVTQSRAVLKGLMDSGKATSSDFNEFAWSALLPPAKVDGAAVEAAEKANSLTQSANFSIMHTLACLYADEGKTKEARELLLKAMDVAGQSEPDSAIWLALAMIAEQYGETDAAQTMYARVEKPGVDSPGSNYGIARQRLEVLKTTGAASKNAGH
jgi:Tfp pilus assembly protein PilF